MVKRVKGFFITGTDTGVGKTVVTACLLSLFKKYRLDAGVMKPIETGVASGQRSLSDAELLLQTAGGADSITEISPIRLRTPASPYQASRMEKCAINIKTVLREYRRLAGTHDYMLVEGVGGILTPITGKYMVIDLIRELRLPLIVVSRFTLGTLNHTLLTVKTAREAKLPIRGIIFNQTEPQKTAIEKDQPTIIRELSKIPVLGEIPFIKNVSPKTFSPALLAVIEKKLDFNALRKGCRIA